MTKGRHIYGEIENKTELHQAFRKIRKYVTQAHSRVALTELYKQASYLIELSYSPAWHQEFGKEIGNIRNIAEEEFARTARAINRKAEALGTAGNYAGTAMAVTSQHRRSIAAQSKGRA